MEWTKVNLQKEPDHSFMIQALNSIYIKDMLNSHNISNIIKE